jgi:hypothetical protein
MRQIAKAMVNISGFQIGGQRAENVSRLMN